MREYLRGRNEGEIPVIIRDELERVGAPADRITHADSELAAVREALQWARPGDLVLLPVHSQRSEVLRLLTELTERKWKPGDGLPEVGERR